MPTENDIDTTAGASLPDLGPEFNAAREHLRATVLALIDDGMHDGDPLKCMVTAATALLGQMTVDRDRLAATVKSLEAEHAAALDRAYDDGWSEGLGSSGADS